MTTIYIFTLLRGEYPPDLVFARSYNTRKEAQKAMRKKLLKHAKAYFYDCPEDECDKNFLKEIKEDLKINPNYFFYDVDQEIFAVKKAKHFN